jgi:ubiquinone/menaquinone biosynthesis C-methylase UbiE
MLLSNKRIYESKSLVRYYSNEILLQKPEQTILNFLNDRLKNIRMLDIGVGGGRTTYHFAKKTKEYIAIDYSENMIKACKERFQNFPRSISFKVCDVRSMGIFENGYFDFLLFSFNGIDYVSHEDRLKALKEVRRIGRSGGYFCFSTHNLNSDVEKSFTIKFSKNPIRILRNISKAFLLKILNSNITPF